MERQGAVNGQGLVVDGGRPQAPAVRSETSCPVACGEMIPLVSSRRSTRWRWHRTSSPRLQERTGQDPLLKLLGRSAGAVRTGSTPGGREHRLRSTLTISGSNHRPELHAQGVWTCSTSGSGRSARASGACQCAQSRRCRRGGSRTNIVRT